MADAKICDRCGKAELNVYSEKLSLRKERYKLIDRKFRHSTTYDCDLCMECGEKLKKFLKGVELEGGI